MKVLHINTNYIGTTLHQNMINALEASDVENDVFVPTCTKYKAAIVPNANVHVYKCFWYWDGLSFYFKQWKIWRTFASAFSLDDYDLLHAYTVSTDGNVAYQANKKYGIKYIVAVRNTDMNYFFKKRFYLRKRGVKILLNAERICFLSRAYQEQLLAKYIPEKHRETIRQKSVLMPNGIDDYWLRNLNSNDDLVQKMQRMQNKQLRIVFAGRIDRFKNCRLTVDACDILKRKGWNVEFHVAGSIAEQAEFDYINSSGFLVYHGRLTRESLIDLYRNSDIYVMPSHSESFGLTYVEAMSQALPVVYTRGQGFDGQHSDGEVGYAVSDTDPNELAETILKCVKAYNSLSANAVHAAKQYNWERICLEYRAMYDMIESEDCQ